MNTSLRSKLVLILVIVLNVNYLLWRTFFTIPFGSEFWVVILAMLLLISEYQSFFTAFVLFITRRKKVVNVLPIIKEDQYPHVDVLIATHNEDKELLRKTINGCLHMKYPDPSKVHIYICDDKNRLEIHDLAESMGIHYLGLFNNKHAKSGNYNNAVSKTSSPLIATFDADMIPYSNFLLETVPYFVNPEDGSLNETVGFVQTPQGFYNSDIFHYNLYAEAHIPNEQDYFSREVNVANAALNASVYTGSNTVILRQAILDAGGFPVNTITEDFQLGVQIQSSGYTSIATQEVMASGVTPTDFESVLKQRIRWARGVIQSFYNLKVLINPKLTLFQRLIFTTNYLYWWSYFRRIVYIMAPILFALFDIVIVHNDLITLLMIWAPAYIALQLYLSSFESKTRSQRWGEIYETIMAPYMVVPVLLESLGIKEQKFKVTNKNAQQDKSLRRMIPHLFFLFLIIASLIRFNYGKYGAELAYGIIINFWLLHHLINVLFSVVFFIPRPLYRKSERFLTDYDVYFKVSDETFVKGEGIDLSEGGFSFTLPYRKHFDATNIYAFALVKGKLKAKLSAKLLRVGYREDMGYTYSFQIETFRDDSELKYLQMIYDQRNLSLAQERNPLITELEILYGAIKRILDAKIRERKAKKPMRSVKGVCVFEEGIVDDCYLYLSKNQDANLTQCKINGNDVSLRYLGKLSLKENHFEVYEHDLDAQLIHEESEVSLA